jgi:hypothetical protein
VGDRFYAAQIKALGSCPGYSGKRKKNMAWDDAKKKKVVDLYLAGEPTPENSMEIVKEIADDLDESPNGVRMILSKAGVYVTKTAAAKTSTAKSSTGTARVSKEDSQARLIAAINTIGATVDEEIISKLTGKAAVYLATIIESK